MNETELELYQALITRPEKRTDEQNTVVGLLEESWEMQREEEEARWEERTHARNI